MKSPIFQHRHYKVMAQIIATLPAEYRENAAERFAFALHGTNPNYDRERFLAAAMGKPENGRDK